MAFELCLVTQRIRDRRLALQDRREELEMAFSLLEDQRASFVQRHAEVAEQRFVAP